MSSNFFTTLLLTWGIGQLAERFNATMTSTMRSTSYPSSSTSSTQTSMPPVTTTAAVRLTFKWLESWRKPYSSKTSNLPLVALLGRGSPMDVNVHSSGRVMSLALSGNHSLPHVSLQPGKISRVEFINEGVVPLATG
jgi:hypothetical protein